MTGLATSSGPTLLGKLRALEERIDSAEYVEERIFDFADLANLLPQIIAEIDSDAQDAARLDSRAIRIDNPKHNPPFSVLHRNIDLRAAIDAAQERT